MKPFWTTVLWLVFASTSLGESAPSYKLETIGSCTIADFSESMRGALQSQGFRVIGPSGPFCEVWLRASVPQKTGGSDYSTVAPGTFMGVISYLSKGGDYRGQAVKVGTYILRYQTIPQDGNHLGVSPTSDFFLLSPASADTDPNAVIEYQELIKLSKQASGTNHPNPLNLTTPTGDSAPAFKEADESHWVLEVKTKAKPSSGAEADFPIAVVLVGKSEG